MRCVTGMERDAQGMPTQLYLGVRADPPPRKTKAQLKQEADAAKLREWEQLYGKREEANA